MTFTRKITIEISFDVYSDDRFVSPSIRKTSESEKEYINKKDAYEKGGELKTWAENVAEFKAVKIASDHVGASIPNFRDSSTWKEIYDVYGSTYSAHNISYEVISVSEPTIPQAIIDLYTKIKKRIKSELRKNIERQTEIDNIENLKKSTTESLKKIKKLTNDIQKTLKIINADEFRMKELEDQYPEIIY